MKNNDSKRKVNGVNECVGDKVEKTGEKRSWKIARWQVHYEHFVKEWRGFVQEVPTGFCAGYELGVRIRSHDSNTTWNSGEFPRYVYLLVIQFLETPEFPMFSISGKLRNSDVSNFRKIRTLTFFVISHSFMYFTFHLWLCSFPLFHVIILTYVLRSLSVPGTYLSHSLVYKHLYSVARIPELRLLFLFHSSDSSSLSSSLFVTHFPDPEIPESGNSHAHSNSEIRDPVEHAEYILYTTMIL